MDCCSALGVVQPWQVAQEKTRLAEQEASSASLAAEGANRSLREAQLAERAVAEAGSKHAQVTPGFRTRLPDSMLLCPYPAVSEPEQAHIIMELPWLRCQLPLNAHAQAQACH